MHAADRAGEGVFDDQGNLIDPTYGEPAFHTEDRSLYLPSQAHEETVARRAETAMIDGLAVAGFEITAAQRAKIRELARQEFWGGKLLARISRPKAERGWGNPQEEKSRARERRNHFMFVANRPGTWRTLLDRLERALGGEPTCKSYRASRESLRAMEIEAELYGNKIIMMNAAKALAEYVNVSRDPELWGGSIDGRSLYSAYMTWKRENASETRGR